VPGRLNVSQEINSLMPLIRFVRHSPAIFTRARGSEQRQDLSSIAVPVGSKDNRMFQRSSIGEDFSESDHPSGLPETSQDSLSKGLSSGLTNGFAPQTEERHGTVEHEDSGLFWGQCGLEEWDSKLILESVSQQFYQQRLSNDCLSVCAAPMSASSEGFPKCIPNDWEPHSLLPQNTPPENKAIAAQAERHWVGSSNEVLSLSKSARKVLRKREASRRLRTRKRDERLSLIAKVNSLHLEIEALKKCNIIERQKNEWMRIEFATLLRSNNKLRSMIRTGQTTP
jgi:hypothetical protein